MVGWRRKDYRVGSSEVFGEEFNGRELGDVAQRLMGEGVDWGFAEL